MKNQQQLFILSFFYLSLYFMMPDRIFALEEGSFIQSFKHGEVDWSNSLLKAKGIGLPPADAKSSAEAKLAAERAAKIVAYRNLAEMVNGVHVNSETTVENYTTKDSLINTRVNGFIKGAREVEIKYYDDGAVEITLEVALNGEGGLANIILPSLSEPQITEMNEPLADPQDQPLVNLEQKEEALESEGVERSGEKETTGENIETMQGVELAQEQPTGEEIITEYTGLVLDTRGLDVQPAISPKILTEENEEIYGVGLADPYYRSEMGLVEYRSNLELAKQDDRVTQVPFVIKGINISGKNKSDVIIKTTDAKKFQELLESKNIVERCRVLFVLE